MAFTVYYASSLRNGHADRGRVTTPLVAIRDHFSYVAIHFLAEVAIHVASNAPRTIAMLPSAPQPASRVPANHVISSVSLCGWGSGSLSEAL
jgi:hypothetical protein